MRVVLFKSLVDARRVRILHKAAEIKGPIVYWMERDQRVQENWALLYAQQLAKQYEQSLVVVFCLSQKQPARTLRQFDFMMQGLQEVQASLHDLHIPFYLVVGDVDQELITFAKKHKVGAVVTDFNPLRYKKKLIESLVKKMPCSLYEVDAHNIIPCWVASQKKEFGAYTLRPKLYKLLSSFLVSFPRVQKQVIAWNEKVNEIAWDKLLQKVDCDRTVEPVAWVRPGEKQAHKMLRSFLQQKLTMYDQKRNDPTADAQSNLSPYLHFGQISAQTVALAVQDDDYSYSSESKKAFLEELIVRKELTDNYCYYEPAYDTIQGFPAWAQTSLQEHGDDDREYVYTLHQFEQAKTHEGLWNAAQLEMVKTGKMHGYMRMYWAKKILEWSKTVQEALKIALYLNDKYSLDGQDPNGYVGVAWAIGGLHDRAWFERAVYGKVRYMNYNGCKSKFDVKKYMQNNHNLSEK